MTKITKSIGGDRLGSGNRMKVSMNGYGRSTHNLSRAWRSSMAPGTLVPCFVEPILAGDTFDIDIDTMIRTLPTNGPLFGRFKIQIDFFKADMRLYNKMLHNNLSKVGLDMKKVLLPMMEVKGTNLGGGGAAAYNEDPNQVNISPDSLLSYLKIKGLGTSSQNGYQGEIKRQFLAIPMIAYWEIYQNYYANKQEENGYVITSEITANQKPQLSTAWYFGNGAPNPNKQDIYRDTDITINVGVNDRLTFTGDNINIDNLELNANQNTGGLTPQYRTIRTYGFEVLKETNTFIEVLVKPSTNINQLISTNTPIVAPDPNNPISVPSGIKLEKFPLTNIEKTRDNIFAQPQTAPLIIDGNYPQPYKASLGTWLKEKSEVAPRSVSSLTMGGLGIKTYNSDRYNNWIKTDWIDGVNGISAVSAVPIVDGKFTIDSLNLMQKIYNLLNRIALSGGTYQDWLETTTGLNLTYNPEIPIFVGGINGTIEFNEVISTAETSGTEIKNGDPLGTLAGRGYQANQSNGKIIIKAKEHGFIIGIISITPEIDYSQGNAWFNNINNMDKWHKPELSQIGYQELITDEMAAWDTGITKENNLIFKSAGKQTAWIHYQTAVNETYGKFAIQNSEMFMTLNRQYEYTKGDPQIAINDLTTYIDPTKYNYAFAQTDLEAQNFWVQVGMKVTARRIMSAKSIPNL